MAIRKSSSEKSRSPKAAAAKKNSSGKSSREVSPIWKRRFLLGGFVSLVILIAGAVIFLLWQIPQGLLYKNPRMVLSRVEIRSSDEYWRDKKAELLKMGGIKTGASMFSLDVGKIRAQIKREGSFEDVKVQLILPDMILFDLVERYPRAVIGNSFVDEKGVKFSQKKSSKVNRNLPRIIGDVKNPGGVKEALELIMEATKEWPNIEIKQVDVSNSGRLLVDLEFNHDRSFKVFFFTDSSFADSFNRLNNVLLKCYQTGKFPQESIELYKDRAVFR